MPSLFKKIIVSLILTSFLSMAFFSFVFMLHEPGERMSGDCPFSPMETSLCPQDVLAVVLHHFSAYQTFFSVPVFSSVTVLITSLLLVAFAFFLLSANSLLFEPTQTINYSYNTPLTTPYDRKIIRWLSLFENSPSFS